MSTDPEIPEDDEDEEGGAEFSVTDSTELNLMDGQCWVFDPDLLDPALEYEGVLAVQFRDGGLWWLSGATRKWSNVEDGGKPSAKSGKIRSIQ